MKKLCCKIELRIAKIIQKVEDDVLGEMLYYSDGYIILENNQFEGFVTRDYL